MGVVSLWLFSVYEDNQREITPKKLNNLVKYFLGDIENTDEDKNCYQELPYCYKL